MLLTLWMIFSPADYAHASETTVQVSPLDPNPVSDTAAIATPITVEIVENKIEAAQIALQQAAETQASVIVTIIQANVPNTNTQDATAIATTQEPIATAVSEATVKVQEANAAIQSAETAVAVATTAQFAVDSQQVVVATATTNLNNAQTNLNTVTQEVEIQTAVVATETSELNDLQNTPSDSKTYTTEGYVAPVAPETPTVTTTTLPTMYDGFTKINTPFDIKMGNTVYEGQGTNSQIYVTSKATITFGNGDYNWWDFPAGPHISVFGSDFMNDNANGSSTVITTTETTLEVDWNLHKFAQPNGPITNVNWKMTVNPTTGEWTGVGTVAGNTTNLHNGPRIGVREIAGQAVKPMTNVTNEDLTAQITDQTLVVATETAVLATLTEEKEIAVAIVADKTIIKANEIVVLDQLTQIATATIQAADSLVNTAITKVDEAVIAMTNVGQVTINYYAEERAAQIAAAQAAAQAAAAQAEQEAVEAEAAAAQAEADRIAAEEAAAQAEAEAQQAEADRIAAEEAAEQAAQEAAEQEEAAAQAEAEAAEAEAEAARQAEENAKAEAEAKEAEAEAARQAEENAKAELEAKEQKAEEAKEKEEELKEIAEDAKDGKELTEEQKEILVDALLEDLKPGESVSAAAVQASGVSYADLPPSTPIEVRTDENGNALVITAAVAANIELVQDPGALLNAAFTDPGAALAALGSIGADMTEAEREEATDMVVATVVAAGAAINAAAVAAGGASGGSTGGGGGSGGGSGANSPGSRGGRKW